MVSCTYWEAIDDFIRDLAVGEACGRHSECPYYEALKDTVCRGAETALSLVRNPYIPFFIITYYLIFHKRNLELAVKILDRVKVSKTPLNGDEECMFKVLSTLASGGALQGGLLGLISSINDEGFEACRVLKYLVMARLGAGEYAFKAYCAIQEWSEKYREAVELLRDSPFIIPEDEPKPSPFEKFATREAINIAGTLPVHCPHN